MPGARAVHAALAVAALSALTGCPTPRVDRLYPPPTPEELLARRDAQLGRLGTLRSEAKVDYLADKGDRVKVTMTFVVRPPASLRIEAESPLGGSVASLASDGTRFQLLDTRNNRFLAGAASPGNLARLLRVRLTPADVVAVVGGSVPRLDGVASSEVGWDGDNGGFDLLTLTTADGARQTLRFTARDRGGDLAGAELKDASGAVVYRIEHADFSDAGGARLPERTVIAQPAQEADARIRWRSRELHVEVEGGVFQLAAPPGLPIEEVGGGE